MQRKRVKLKMSKVVYLIRLMSVKNGLSCLFYCLSHSEVIVVLLRKLCLARHYECETRAIYLLVIPSPSSVKHFWLCCNCHTG